MQFHEGKSVESHGLDGTETYAIRGIANDLAPGSEVTVTASRTDGTAVEFTVLARVDTATEVDYYRNGGILQYVLRDLVS